MSAASFPSSLFDRPFAEDGDYRVIPDTGAEAGSGRASFELGFPPETQLPLNQGGVAPSRLDFNGILHLLSAFAFWQQSGGMALYNPSLDYSVPNIVYHDNSLWWCVAANGPEVELAGPVEPGSNTEYWITLLSALSGGGTGGGGTGGGNVPVGMVIKFWGTSAPDGYFACDGGGFDETGYPLLYAALGDNNTLPDLRGMFVRGHDPQGTVDPDGASRAIGSIQPDAQQRVQGSLTNYLLGVEGSLFGNPEDRSEAGALAFGSVRDQTLPLFHGNGRFRPQALVFDSARDATVRTATENRPQNVSLLFCIRHD